MNVAIVGLGVVGRGVYDIITNDLTDITVRYVVELDKEKTKGLSCVADSYLQVLEDKEVDCIIELIGGTTVAYRFVKEALLAGKHVVTANKALLSKHFEELTVLANTNKVYLKYEASVGGAINILDPLNTITRVNKINKIEGIINGSTNFVLSKIFIDDCSLSAALTEATHLGYIETGTTDDMEGLDLLRKINILSMLSYHQYIDESDIVRVPLTTLTNEFYSHVKSCGLSIKYVATSVKVGNEISIQLEPVIIGKDSIYSSVNYEDNIITIYGEYHAKQSFIGQGAGRFPTAQAVVYDVLKINDKDNVTQVYSNKYTINNELYKNHYLVLKNNTFIKINNISLKEILSDESITAVARMGEGTYEAL